MSRWLALLVALAPAPAHAQVALAWKLTPGETFHAERRFSRKESVDVNNKQLRQESVSTWLVRLDVKERASAGTVVKATLEEVQHRVSGTLGQAAIDDRLAEKMRGASFTLTVAPTGKIVSLAGYAGFLKQAAGDKTERAKLLGATLPEDAIREALGDLFGALPDRAVNPGDVWQTKTTDPIPFFGALDVTSRHEYHGPKDGLYVIATTTKAEYRRPAKDDVLIRVVKGGLQGEPGKGTTRFDAARGRLVEAERSMLVRGDLVLETMGKQTAVRFTSENELRVRVFEKRE